MDERVHQLLLRARADNDRQTSLEAIDSVSQPRMQERTLKCPNCEMYSVITFERASPQASDEVTIHSIRNVGSLLGGRGLARTRYVTRKYDLSAVVNRRVAEAE